MVTAACELFGRHFSPVRHKDPDLYFFLQQLSARKMSEPLPIPGRRSEPVVDGLAAPEMIRSITEGSSDDPHSHDILTPAYSSTPPTPDLLSRNSSYIDSGSFREDWEAFPPPEKITFFDIFDNLALPSKLEKWQTTLAVQKQRVKIQQERLRSTGASAKDRAVSEVRKRVPRPEEQLDKYRKRMRKSVDELSKRWTDKAAVTAREKMSFIAGVLNVFISGYLIGAQPEHFYYWFSAQLGYFMPIRFYTYQKKGYHYFLADLCYFVNLLTLLSVWAFPQSKRLFISTYCLAYGNNAVAIAMWRNSMVFHSLDKVTSLFIHVMPPVTLHCLVHLTPAEMLRDRFPAIYDIKSSPSGAPEHYSLWAMIGWASVPYAVWQLSYHLFITVRRREKIAAGRPTSFTWLRKSYAQTFIGKVVLNLPIALQEPAFMLIQYCYALLTMIPCPLWFWYRWASASFLLVVFGWSIWNGATYYIDVFGKRFQKELEQMQKDMAKWQNSPDVRTGAETPSGGGADPAARKDTEDIPPLDAKPGSTGVEVATGTSI